MRTPEQLNNLFPRYSAYFTFKVADHPIASSNFEYRRTFPRGLIKLLLERPFQEILDRIPKENKGEQNNPNQDCIFFSNFLVFCHWRPRKIRVPFSICQYNNSKS